MHLDLICGENRFSEENWAHEQRSDRFGGEVIYLISRPLFNHTRCGDHLNKIYKKDTYTSF